ncbi:hypothetical protein EXIGLDRAFT_760738 [Exidia glandulosa HHB12029]|uniref:Uncharacterized protein n=1 Tax=Exidia glandulosa HHB12029 TaxID=1314781 RepID=A0A165P1Z4_EXIGL|nr:hypothetical protein EXIGLDRAFT_760738 [Exidia glandulosa HHB12029]
MSPSEHSRSEYYIKLRFATALALLAAEVPSPSLPHLTASPQTDGEPVEYREVQGYESPEFLAYFPSFTTLKGGVPTGFNHVTDAPPLDVFKLYHVVSPQGSSPNRVTVREVDPAAGLCSWK